MWVGSFAWQHHVNKTDLLDRPSVRPSCSLTCRLWPSSLTLNGYSVKGRDLLTLSRTGICRPPVWHPTTSMSVPATSTTTVRAHIHTPSDAHTENTLSLITDFLVSWYIYIYICVKKTEDVKTHEHTKTHYTLTHTAGAAKLLHLQAHQHASLDGSMIYCSRQVRGHRVKRGGGGEWTGWSQAM